MVLDKAHILKKKKRVLTKRSPVRVRLELEPNMKNYNDPKSIGCPFIDWKKNQADFKLIQLIIAWD